MEFTVGPVREGKVKSITNFGAFIALPENKTGLVHISEVDRIVTAVDITEELKAPVEAGQRLGTLTLQANGTVLAEIPLVAPEAVARRTWWDLTRELLQQICFCADE